MPAPSELKRNGATNHPAAGDQYGAHLPLRCASRDARLFVALVLVRLVLRLVLCGCRPGDSALLGLASVARNRVPLALADSLGMSIRERRRGSVADPKHARVLVRLGGGRGRDRSGRAEPLPDPGLG